MRPSYDEMKQRYKMIKENQHHYNDYDDAIALAQWAVLETLEDSSAPDLVLQNIRLMGRVKDLEATIDRLKSNTVYKPKVGTNGQAVG